MDRAEVDLDEPAKNSSGAASNSADDLLAQLAGDEVDRMLSEVDAAAPEPLNTDRAIPESAAAAHPSANPEARPPSRLPANTRAPEKDAVFEATEAALDGFFDELDAGNRALAGPPAASLATTDPAPPAAVSKESIEQVITQRAQELIVQARIEAAADSAALAVPPALSPSGEPLSAADALAAEMEADEREHFEALKRMKAAASTEAAEAATVAQAISAPADTAPTQIDEDKVDYSRPDKIDRVPLLVRVLEWINAPLAGLSDNVRTAIGKVAIVTTLNAIGVFLYVVLFRRH